MEIVKVVEMPFIEILNEIEHANYGVFDLDAGLADQQRFVRVALERAGFTPTRVDRRELKRGDVTVTF